jgi:signal transduction histidine kinase
LTIKRLRYNLQKTAALAAVSRMTASIAHEIRNPLHIILSSARRMSKSDDKLKRDVYMTYISDEIERLSGITDNYLSIIRQDKQSTKNNTAAMIKTLEIAHEGEFFSRNIKFNVTIIDDVDLYVSKNSFMHVSNNLVRNAMESIHEKGKIHITQQLSIDRDELVIEISDNGIGFGKKNQKKIFEPFFTTKEDGTGLGLYICKLLVESDNGKISAKRENEFTVFTITYPYNTDES